MKLPEIRTRYKIRDTKICRLYIEAETDVGEIASRFNISRTRVYQILYANRDFLKVDNNWEKQKRIRWLKKQIHTRGDSRKDSADLQEQLRRELEGEKAVVDQSQHQHFTIVYERVDKDKILASRRSVGRMGVTGQMEGVSSGETLGQDDLGGSRIAEESNGETEI